MVTLCPLPYPGPPEEWPGLTVLAATILLEAEGEGDVGQLGVGYVIRNRARQNGESIHRVCLAPYQFSCWNADYAGMRKARLTGIDPYQWERAWKAGVASWWGYLLDPTHGADHYLNVEATKRLRGGTLPAWFNPARVTATLGKHTYLKLG